MQICLASVKDIYIFFNSFGYAICSSKRYWSPDLCLSGYQERVNQGCVVPL